jgi:hypothetical protein
MAGLSGTAARSEVAWNKGNVHFVEGLAMNNKIRAVIAIAIVAAVMGSLVVVRQNVALAQRKQALAEQLQAQEVLLDRIQEPLRWEYRVLSSSGSDKVMSQEISKLTDEGWEFVAVIQPALPTGTPARLLFKRAQK